MGMLLIFINTNLSRMFASGASIIFVTIIFPFISELKNKSVWQHTASLPVTRKSIVTARFIVSLVIIVINIMLWVGAYKLLMVLLVTDPKYALSNSIIIMVSMNLLLNTAVFYLVYFRFNFTSAIGIYLFLMIVPSFVQTYLNLNHGLLIENFNQPLALSIVATGLLIISLFSSIKHFNKKDL
tara:strand:- start:6646 stop:7194 length:549 start_codon:yes stop_codon:yes gene_type:complete